METFTMQCSTFNEKEKEKKENISCWKLAFAAKQ